MTITTDLMEQIKHTEKLTSNYQLAKLTQIPENRLSDYRKGLRRPDTYAATRLALAAGREPIEVIAELEAETETNPTKRQFWLDFLTRAACISASVTVLASGSLHSDAHAADNFASAKLSEHQIMRIVRAALQAFRRLARALKTTPGTGVEPTACWIPA